MPVREWGVTITPSSMHPKPVNPNYGLLVPLREPRIIQTPKNIPKDAVHTAFIKDADENDLLDMGKERCLVLGRRQ